MARAAHDRGPATFDLVHSQWPAAFGVHQGQALCPLAQAWRLFLIKTSCSYCSDIITFDPGVDNDIVKTFVALKEECALRRETWTRTYRPSNMVWTNRRSVFPPPLSARIWAASSPRGSQSLSHRCYLTAPVARCLCDKNPAAGRCREPRAMGGGSRNETATRLAAALAPGRPHCYLCQYPPRQADSAGSIVAESDVFDGTWVRLTGRIRHHCSRCTRLVPAKQWREGL